MNSNFPYQGCLSRKLIGVLLLAIALGGCGGGGGGEAGTPDYKPGPGPEEPGPEPGPEEPGPDPDLEVLAEAWPFEEEQSHLVAAAKVAGYYAVANASSMVIEIRDISKSVLHTISASDISPLLPDMGLAHDAPICGMTFTPSGRFLYIAVCNSQTGDDKDAILALNVNTQMLSVFDRVSLGSTSKSPQSHYGMSYFASQLYVGSDTGVYRYNADRNSAFDRNSEPLGGPTEDPDHISTPKAVKDIALDMVAKHLYVLTDDTIYRLPHTKESLSLATVYKDSDLSRISFSRVFGRGSTAGLYLTRDNNDDTEFLFVPKDEVRKGNAFSPEQVNLNVSNVLDFTTTADGKILYSDGQPYTLADKFDDKLSYQEWLRDELVQYVTAIKSLIASRDFSTTNTISPDGFLHRKIFQSGHKPNAEPVADNVGWALYLLLAADKANHDPEIEPLVELLIRRHAGLMNDKLGGLKTVDGHFVRNYETEGTPKEANPQTQVYTSMKFLPAVHKAVEMYPDNERIEESFRYLRQVFVRSSDTIRANQRVTWRVDDFGPIRNNNGMSNETWIYGDLGAAQDPLATRNYASYVYERDNFKTDNWLKGEPVILASHSAFIVMGGTLVLEHHFEDSDWKKQNNNYYAVTQAESDDLGAPYFAAFSAGNNPAKDGNYYNDGPSDHPGNILHFPALLGFGQHGKLGAMVGGYFAYRDGIRQAMTNGSGGDDIKLLTRWSFDDPEYVMNSVGIADFWFGAIGLAETVAPGTTAELRNNFYRPEVLLNTDSDGNQVVLFSAITPRHVIGKNDDGSQQSFGFQRSPFTVPGRQQFDTFEVSDPEGDWVELDDVVSAKHDKQTIFTNPYFEDGLVGWDSKGDGTVVITDGVTGQGAKVTGNSILTQTVYQPLALENSRFRVTAFIRPEQVTTAQGFVRTYWSESGDSNAVPGTVVDSNTIEAGDSGQLVSVDTSKPAGANYLHIEYVVEGSAGQSFVFDNTALQLFGASNEIDNGDFEDGSQNWDLSHSQVSIINDSEDNHALEFLLSGGMTAWRSAETDIDVVNDPVGTRYIFRLTLGEHAITDSEFEIKVDITDDDPETKTVDWQSVAAIEKESPDEITFTMRKRPGETNFRVIFRMRQNSNESVATDRVVIDNFRFDKQRLLLAEECTGSVTGC